jgi:fucose permease
VIGLALGAPFIWLLGNADSRVVAFVALSLFGFFRGIYDSNLFASLYEVIRPASRATATGLMLAVAFFVGGAAPVAIGRMGEQFGLGPALGFTSGLYAVAAVAIALAAHFFLRPESARLAGPVENRHS